MTRSIGSVLLLIMLSQYGHAQDTPAGGKNNYVVSTTKIPQLQPIILTAESLKKEDGENFGDFQIVIYGPNVRELTDTENMEKYIVRAKAAGAAILVCNLSLERLKIKPKDLHEDIMVIEHAFTHLLLLQKDKNYYSLQL